MFDVPWSDGNEVLLSTLAEIGLPNRLVASMKKDGVILVGAFIQLNEFDVLHKRGLGRKSLNETRKTLAKFGLSLGTELRGWDDDLAGEARAALGRKLHKRIFELNPSEWKRAKSLEDELLALLLEVEDSRNAEMLSLFFGFDEAGPKTLESVGESFGLTRERVRQIAARAHEKLSAIWRPMHHLSAAKEVLVSGIKHPFTRKGFAEALNKAGITTIEFHVEGVLQALELVGERHSIQHTRIGELEIYGKRNEIAAPKKLVKFLRKETSAHGCTNTQRLALLVGMEIDDALQIQELLSFFPEVHWLDSNRTWLLSTMPARSRLANVANRVFSVANSVEMNELRAALLRPTRVTFVPPISALANFLEFHDIATVQNRIAIASEEFQHSELGKNDMGLFLAFKELGSPVKREDLEDYCIDHLGMNTNSFYVYLSYSPLVVKLATGVFSLVGQDVDPGAIEQLKMDIKESKFEEASGWSKSGTLWWHFQVDRPTINGGARVVPAFVFSLTSGEWKVRSIDGLQMGLARVENGYISGLRLTFSALGLSNRDFVQMDFDIASREVFVQVVGDEPQEFNRVFEGDEFDQEEALDDDNES